MAKVNQSKDSSSNDIVANGSQSTSYASKLTPGEDQAIVLDSVDDITVTDYVYAVASIIGPQNIHYASRISLSRICMYLSNKTLVDKITDEKHNKIKIKDQLLEVRPLKAKMQRVIFSNVSPAIPNDVLIDKISSYGITVTNVMTPLRTGIVGEGFSHI